MFTRPMISSLCLVALAAIYGSAIAADGYTDARSQLIGMATKLAEAKQFSVSMRMGYDAALYRVRGNR